MIVDTNVYLSQWPFRRLPFDETPLLVEQLQQNGIGQAWAGSFDALLHKDVAAVNLRTAFECRQHGQGILVPVGCVNPGLPDWQEDLRRCVQQHGMKCIRLHPNYHQYTLDDARFLQLLELAADDDLLVQIVVRMQDTRTHHPLVQVPDVDVSPLAEVLQKPEQPTVQLLNALKTVRAATLDRLAEVQNLYVEISMLEGVGGIQNLLKQFPADRVLFGSYFPFFYLQSALLKMQESEPGATLQSAIEHENAERVMPMD